MIFNVSNVCNQDYKIMSRRLVITFIIFDIHSNLLHQSVDPGDFYLKFFLLLKFIITILNI